MRDWADYTALKKYQGLRYRYQGQENLPTGKLEGTQRAHTSTKPQQFLIFCKQMKLILDSESDPDQSQNQIDFYSFQGISTCQNS